MCIRDREEGVKLVSNSTSSETLTIKVYLAKYKKGECGWLSPVFYRVFDESGSVELNEWSFLYSNEKYSVYSMFAYELPDSLPYDGELPPASEAPFVRYEAFETVWDRKRCEYSDLANSFSTTKGSDYWVLTSSDEDQCVYSYVKSTPFGCDNEVPSTDDIDLDSDCSCTPESSSSSISSSSSSTEEMSTVSTSSSSEKISSESSSLNSESSEELLSAKNVDPIYMRVLGEPFNDYQFVLDQISSNVWQATSHSAETLTTGTITLTMEESGRFVLDMNVVVNGCSMVVVDSVLSNIKNDNFASYGSYLKGLAPLDKTRITVPCVVDGEEVTEYSCVFSHESMQTNTGKNKSVGQVVLDYEQNELQVDLEYDKINLYLSKATNVADSAGSCRAWGFFCLENNDDGTWSVESDREFVRLEYTQGGAFNLTRRYAVSATETEEISMRIPFQDVVNDGLSGYNGFSGLTVVGRNNIAGGVEESNSSDICNDADTLVVLYANEVCSQNSSYFPYQGDLTLTINGGDWDGRDSYDLEFRQINSNLAVWNFSTNSSSSSHEYATLFSQDGTLWKLNLGKFNGSQRSHLYAEFISEGRNQNGFKGIFVKVPRSNMNLSGARSSSDATLMITRKV